MKNIVIFLASAVCGVLSSANCMRRTWNMRTSSLEEVSKLLRTWTRMNQQGADD